MKRRKSIYERLIAKWNRKYGDGPGEPVTIGRMNYYRVVMDDARARNEAARPAWSYSFGVGSLRA